jgi:hypothetical protein
VLFKKDVNGDFLAPMIVAYPPKGDDDLPRLMIYRRYFPEHGCLGLREYIPVAEWQAFEFTEKRTSREAYDRALYWLLPLLLSGMCLAWLIEMWVMIGPRNLNSDFMHKFAAVASVVFLVSLWRWWKQFRRWDIKLDHTENLRG